MSSMNPVIIICVVIAYFIGNISPATLVGKLHGVDIKKEGSGNAGTTNVLRVLGAKAAVATLAIDVLKGVVAVLMGLHFGGDKLGQFCFIAVVLGHIYPVLLKFKGGKGVATSIGACFTLNWMSALPLPFIAIGIVAVTRKMSLGSIIAAICYPVIVYFLYPQGFICAIIMSCLVVFAHRSNIGRLIRGEENTLHFGKAKDNAEVAKESAKVAAEDAKKVVADVKEAVADALPVEAHRYVPAVEPAVIINKDDVPVDYFTGVKPLHQEPEYIRKIAIIGCGSFGTALADVLAHNGHEVTMWARNPKQIEEMETKHTNSKYLPGVLISDKLKYTGDIETAVKGRDIVVYAVPAQSFGQIADKTKDAIDDGTIVVNLAKGIERGTLRTMSQIADDTFKNVRYVALSGPSHAEEIARNYPTTVVCASKDIHDAEIVQDAFMSNRFRVYTSTDVTGVQLGGALKNVIAIATGVSDGMKLGDNTKAALMTRGMHEIRRLGIAMGSQDATFSGLSGIGDLIVTCDSDLSRNRRCGILIGSGMTAKEAVEAIGTTVEGFYTVEAAHELAEKLGIEMPITDAMYGVIKGETTPQDSASALMGREKKEESKL